MLLWFDLVALGVLLCYTSVAVICICVLGRKNPALYSRGCCLSSLKVLVVLGASSPVCPSSSLQAAMWYRLRNKQVEAIISFHSRLLWKLMRCLELAWGIQHCCALCSLPFLPLWGACICATLGQGPALGCWMTDPIAKHGFWMCLLFGARSPSSHPECLAGHKVRPLF